jgi:predicted PurR-regulated permease PerM
VRATVHTMNHVTSLTAELATARLVKPSSACDSTSLDLEFRQAFLPGRTASLASANHAPALPAERAPESTARTPVDARGLALNVLAVAAAILLARYMQSVLIPFVLAGLVFYALDPIVDRLQRLRVPRSIGAALAIALVVGATAAVTYSLMDDALRVIEELPAATRKVRAEWSANIKRTPTAMDKVQDAARAIDATTAEAASSAVAPLPRGVTRVQIVEPAFRVSDYLLWSSLGALGLLGQVSLVLFLAFFLLVYDDLFKRKLVENIGPTLGRKRITVQILNDIASQIEAFIVVQVFTSVVVGVATGLSLWAIGFSNPWVWGVAAGVFNVVPYFGPLIVAAGLGIVGYLQFESVAAALGAAGVAMLITTLEGFWLTPALMRKVAQMNRIAIFAGIMFWSWLWGVPGMLLAIPMMVVVKVVCDRIEGLQPIGSMLGE